MPSSKDIKSAQQQGRDDAKNDRPLDRYAPGFFHDEDREALRQVYTESAELQRKEDSDNDTDKLLLTGVLLVAGIGC